MLDWFKENKIHSFPHELQKQEKTQLVYQCMIWQNSCDFNLGWWSKIPRVDGQKSHGQLSVAVKSHVVKCQLWSKVLRSNVSCGQKSLSQMSVAFKCPLSKVPWSNVSFGQMSHSLLWSNVPCGPMSLPPNVVKCLRRFIVPRSKVRGQMSHGQMILLSK